MVHSLLLDEVSQFQVSLCSLMARNGHYIMYGTWMVAIHCGQHFGVLQRVAISSIVQVYQEEI